MRRSTAGVHTLATASYGAERAYQLRVHNAKALRILNDLSFALNLGESKFLMRK